MKGIFSCAPHGSDPVTRAIFRCAFLLCCLVTFPVAGVATSAQATEPVSTTTAPAQTDGSGDKNDGTLSLDGETAPTPDSPTDGMSTL